MAAGIAQHGARLMTFTSRGLGLVNKGTKLPVFTPVAASNRWTH
jgi:hypothetical protein